MNNINKCIILLIMVFSFLIGSASAQEELWDKLSSRLYDLYQQGRYPEAVELAEKVLDVAEETYGAEHSNVATSLNNLAELYRILGRYDESEELFKRSIEITEKTSGANHPDLASSLNNLALLYSSLGQYTEALALYERALRANPKIR